MSEPDNDAMRNAILRRLDQEVEEGADEVLSSVRIDHQQISATWSRALAFAVRTTPIQQFGIGFGVGWISGYLFRRVSRTAAFLVGCAFLAVQGASALGVININWNRLGQVAQQRIHRASQLASQSGLTTSNGSPTEQVVDFCRRHVYMTSGFATGAVVSITF